MSTLNTGSLTVGLSPGFQELGLQRPTAIPESAACKNYDSFVQAAGLNPSQVHTQVCTNHCFVVINLQANMREKAHPL